MIMLIEFLQSTASQTVCNTQEYTKDINVTRTYKASTASKEFCQHKESVWGEGGETMAGVQPSRSGCG